MSTKVEKTFDLTRKEAAELLDVTTRTLDRYINKNRFETRNIAGRVFVSRDDVMSFIEKSRPHGSIKTKETPMDRPKQEAKKPEHFEYSEPRKEHENLELYKIPIEYINKKREHEPMETVEAEDDDRINQDIIESTQEKVYQRLYNELRQEIKAFQQRLEGANYRVGQLESQLKVSVPLLEHQKLLSGHKKEKYNKKILYVLLGILLAFQPIWLILVYL